MTLQQITKKEVSEVQEVQKVRVKMRARANIEF